MQHNFLNKKLIVQVLLTVLISFNASPQSRNLVFERIGTESGLSQNQLTCIYQDSQGMLWFGTQDGLNLYDGYNFRVFRHEPGNENSLLDYAVTTICETDTGIFWIGTREGMSRFNLRMNKFTHYTRNPDSSNSLVDNNVWFIYEDTENNLWIATRGGLSQFNLQTGIFNNYKAADSNSISNNFNFSVVEDKYKNIWIGGRGGVDRYDMNKKKFYNYKLYLDHPNSVSLNGILCLFIKNDKLWIGAYSGLYSTSLNENKITFKKHLLSSDENMSIRSIYIGNDKNLWVGTFREGLFRYFPESGNKFNYKHTDQIGSIGENYISSILEDEHGVLWLGTSSSGINKYNRSSERFRTIILPNPEGETTYGVSSILESRSGNLWVGTKSGNITKITDQFSVNPQFKFYETEKFLKTYFSSIEIRTLMEDNNGRIWAGSFGNGIYIINPETGGLTRMKSESNNKNSLANDFVHSIYKARDGTIWIGTGAGGLNKYNPVEKKFTQYQHNREDSTSISSVEVTAVCEDNKGFIWAGTSIGGLNRMNKQSGKFEHFIHNVKDFNSISSNRIICLYLDEKSNLWIGTFGGGLNKWNPVKSSFDHFTTEQGLPSNIINSIVEDMSGNLWITTDKGLSVFNVESKRFKNYDVNDGLQGNEFVHGAGYSSRISSNIYVGGVNGLNVFNPIGLNTPNKLANIVFTDFKIFNKSVLPGEESALKSNILYTKEVSLSFNENFFTFEFASLDFNNPEKNQYAYKMEEFNKDWINSGNQRFATFTNLDPGEYIFRVKATNSDGVWNEEGASIKVVILSPWWQTWWAYLIYALAIVSILLFVRQYEIKRVKLRNDLQLKDTEAKKLLEVDKLKSRFFANISHEFRTPLTLVLGLTEKLLKKSSDREDKNDFGIIRKNANRLLQLINQLLELSKLEAGSTNIQATKNDLNKFLGRVLSSFSSLADQKNLKLIFNNNPLSAQNKQKEVFLYYDVEKFETVIYNLISNAIKFSPAGEKIEIGVISHLQSVDIRITNTGVGIPKEKLSFVFDRFYQVDESQNRDQEGTGIGLALVREIVELHNGEINVFSEGEKETTFIIRLNVGRAHFNPSQVVDHIPEKDEPAKVRLEFVDGFETEKIASEKVLKESNIKEAKIILIVEDNFDLRNYIREQLEDGFTIFEAEDGEKGLEMAGEMIPDLVISDIMMPKMDGMEMSKKIKSDFKTSHIPIIMLTAKAAREDKIEGLEIGADDYLLKPFDPAELKLKVKNLIKSREQLREKLHIDLLQKPKEVSVPSTERVFLENINKTIENNIENEKFGVDELCKTIGLSRSQFHRKIKAICDQSTTEYIRNFRLHRAADLLKQNAGNMAEIAYHVGFSSQAYFTKSFQELFGCSPSEYKKSHKK